MADTRGEDDEKGGDKGGEQRRTRSTRDRRGRTGASADGGARARRRTTRDEEAAGADQPRTRRTAAGKSADQRAAGRSARLTRRDAAGGETGASRVRTGRTDRDAGRPVTRRPRSDTVRARRAGRGERRPPTRRRYLARRWVALLSVVAVVTAAYLVMFTSLLGVRSVEVIGAKEIPKQDVVDAAAIEHGTPMVRLDADQAAGRVAKLPRVFEVRVERSWPSTVEIIVTERSPVAVLRRGDKIHLIDRTGLDYAEVATAPAGLPTLAMSDVRQDNPAAKAAVTVLAAIPKQLRDQVTTVTAETPGNVRLTLTDGRLVKWGNADENGRKAAVLGALLTRPGSTYDVATPDFPTVSGDPA